MNIIEASGLRKEFDIKLKTGRFRRSTRTVRAVDGVDLRIAQGELVGYLGPNGAGKSTTLKMLTGVLYPSGGEVSVCGLTPVPQRLQLARRIGVVFGQRSQLWWDLPLRDSFDLLHHVYRVPATEHAARLRRYRELLDLDSFLDTPVRQLSLGQRMRGELTAALLHGPQVLFLDEPTIGLDVMSKQAVRGFLADLAGAGDTTIVLTTHDLADIERLCRRIVVIDHGRVVHDGGIDELHARYNSRRRLTVEFKQEVAELLSAQGAGLPSVRGAELLSATGATLTYALENGASLGALVSQLSACGAIHDMSVREPEIEEVIARLYRTGAGTVVASEVGVHAE